MHENEAIYTNRAASYIQLKDFKKALDDCKRALSLNPGFARAFKRMFRIYLSVGNLEKAKEVLNKAMQVDPDDKTNANDLKLLESVQNQERVVQRSVENKDFNTAVSYINQVL